MKFLLTSLFSVCLLLPGMSLANDNLMILLDASNSMWGKVDGQHKISIARDKLTNLLEKETQTYNVGLVTYGNRRKSDCQDINIIAEPGALPHNQLLQQILGIIPKGRSPLGTALQQAAKLSNNILLISDGNESCDTDPCSISKQLKADNPALRINILPLQQEPTPSLTCIASNTGGQLLPTEETLTWQQITSNLEAASSPAINQTPVTSNKPGTIKLSAGASNRPGNLIASFLVYDEDDHHVASYTAQTDVEQNIAPGTYRVDMLWGELKQSHTLNIAPAQTTAYHFDLGPMGEIKLQAKNGSGESVDTNFTIYTKDNRFFASRLLKHAVHEDIPIGTYRVTASLGDQTQETDIHIKVETPAEHVFRFK